MRSRVLENIDRQRLVEITRNLVVIPSPTGEEQAVALYLVEELKSMGLEVSLQEVEPLRFNVIGRLRGTGDGATLMFLGHFDTVTPGPEDPQRREEPVEFKILDDWMIGIGVANMKSAFAAYLMVVEMLRKAKVTLRGDIVIAGVVGEIEKAQVERYQGRRFRGGALGARYLMNGGVTADMAIIGEPTGLRLQVGNLGYIFAKIKVIGKAQHTRSKHLGIDPIYPALKIFEVLRDWEQPYQERHKHPFMQPVVGVGAIEGGYPYKPSVCPPPYCNLFVDIRTLPGIMPLTIKRELEEALEGVKKAMPQVNIEVELYKANEGYEIPKNSHLVLSMAKANKEVFGQEAIFPEPSRYSVASDGSLLHAYGIQAITYGPGGISPEGAYFDMLNQEMVALTNLQNCTKVYALAALDILTKTREELGLK